MILIFKWRFFFSPEFHHCKRRQVASRNTDVVVNRWKKTLLLIFSFFEKQTNNFTADLSGDFCCYCAFYKSLSYICVFLIWLYAEELLRTEFTCLSNTASLWQHQNEMQHLADLSWQSLLVQRTISRSLECKQLLVSHLCWECTYGLWLEDRIYFLTFFEICNSLLCFKLPLSILVPLSYRIKNIKEFLKRHRDVPPLPCWTSDICYIVWSWIRGKKWHWLVDKAVGTCVR